MTQRIFAANWKMHLGPEGARDFLRTFLEMYEPMDDREVWFFPSAIAVSAAVDAVQGAARIVVGVQNVHWEAKGAFTGEVSVSMAREAGVTAALVGHSERRHVFGETDEETGLKVRALLDAGITPMLCVGEKIEQREAGETLAVVERQLSVLKGYDRQSLGHVVLAYEPVWAIGTGKTATPADAAEVHTFIRQWLMEQGADRSAIRVLYGGSVKPVNIRSLMAEPQIDGVLVGGASLEPESWAAIAQTPLD